MASKKSGPKIHTYYKIEGDKAVRLKKVCSRCGNGVFMSEHKGRHTCGKCRLTEFTQ